jgi:simple sugar transport system ATP-binding protein
MTVLVELRHITKAFGAILAVWDVSMVVHEGEVVGLVGDNAAGKSTLMKILSGVHTPDAGEILVHGRAVHFSSPMEARAAGIEMVYQDFALVPELSVTQNIFLGRELTGRGLRRYFLDKREMRDRASRWIERLGLQVPNVEAQVQAISGGQQQAVAIARATAFDARLVIMDEPTASLSLSAIEKVRQTIGELKRAGVSVIVISHRLEDIIVTADRVVVMKHGRVVGERDTARTSADEIVYMIVTGLDPGQTQPIHNGADPLPW